MAASGVTRRHHTTMVGVFSTKINCRRNGNVPIWTSKGLSGAEFTSELFFCIPTALRTDEGNGKIMHRCFKSHELILQHAVFGIYESFNLLNNDPVIINTSGTGKNNSRISSFLNTRCSLKFLVENHRQRFLFL